MTQLRLATTLEELNEKFEHFRTEKGKEVVDNFVPEATDIIISPYAKSGTTWTQQIVHSLRTRGDMDFEEITAVVPWISMAYDIGIDLNAPQKAHPRAFKSHAKWDTIHKGARYIYIIRDPKDVVVSLYRFIGDWLFDTSAISITHYAWNQFLKDDGYWEHINSWWSQFDNPDVLFLCFEDMKEDTDKAIHQIAEFMHIELDDELFDIVRHNASFEFMKAHDRQFDDHLIRDHRNEAVGVPLDATTSKVKLGKVGGYKHYLSQDLVDEFNARWIKETNPAYGLTSYDALREKIQKRSV